MAEVPILVVGGGPAGASAAATLVEAGLPFTAKRRPVPRAPSGVPRGIAATGLR